MALPVLLVKSIGLPDKLFFNLAKKMQEFQVHFKYLSAVSDRLSKFSHTLDYSIFLSCFIYLFSFFRKYLQFYYQRHKIFRPFSQDFKSFWNMMMFGITCWNSHCSAVRRNKVRYIYTHFWIGDERSLLYVRLSANSLTRFQEFLEHKDNQCYMLKFTLVLYWEKQNLVHVHTFPVIFLQFCLYGSWDSLGPEFMHPKLKLCIQPGTCGEIFCCVLDFSFKLL